MLRLCFSKFIVLRNGLWSLSKSVSPPLILVLYFRSGLGICILSDYAASRQVVEEILGDKLKPVFHADHGEIILKVLLRVKHMSKSCI